MSDLRLVSRSLALSALVLGSIACTSINTQAKEDFAKEFSCPEDQVQVKERPDLNAMTVHDEGRGKTASKTPTPPADVAADPARLAKWKKDQADSDASRAGMYAGYEVLELSGCNHHNLMTCHRPHGKGNNSAHPSCSMEKAL